MGPCRLVRLVQRSTVDGVDAGSGRGLARLGQEPGGPAVAMASVISSLSGLSSAPPGLVEVVFSERREIGLSFDERVEELPGQPGGHRFLTVTGIKPGGQAAQDPRMHLGMVVHSIGDQAVHTFKGPEGEAAVQLMRQRPVVFRFWSVPAVEDHYAGSAVGSHVSDANSYMQPAPPQWSQPQTLASVPEMFQPVSRQLPPMPTGQPQHPLQQQQPPQQQPQQQQKPLVSASSYSSSAGHGVISQIDHDIGALHRAHAATPSDQPGGGPQANILIGQLQAALRKTEKELLQLKHDKDREVAEAVATKASNSDHALPTSAYSMTTGQLVQELTAMRLVAQQHEDDAQALREALQAERENSRRLQEELDAVREENATLLTMNEELASELEQGFDGAVEEDGDGAAEVDNAAAPATPPDGRGQLATRYAAAAGAEPSKPPSVAEQLARLAERDAQMPGRTVPRATESQWSQAPSRLSPQAQASASAAATGMGSVVTFGSKDDLASHAQALLRRVQARNGGVAAPERSSADGYR